MAASTRFSQVLSVVRRAPAYVCHNRRSPTLENNPWRALTRAGGWATVAVALALPLVGTVLRYVPWPERMHDVIGGVVGLLLYIDLMVLLLTIGLTTVFLSTAVPRHDVADPGWAPTGDG